jgi:uridine kinase
MTAPTLVGIAGGSCSGKTTFARHLAELLTDVGVRSISFDSYYRPLGHLPLAERHAVNFDHPDSLDGDLLVENLRALRRSEAVDEPVYDFATHARLPETHRVTPAPVVLVDGILLLAFDRLVEVLDYSVFIDAPEDVRLARRIARDTVERGRTGASVRQQFAATVAPMHDRFVQPSADRAALRIGWGRDLVQEATALADRLR